MNYKNEGCILLRKKEENGLYVWETY